MAHINFGENKYFLLSDHGKIELTQAVIQGTYDLKLKQIIH